MSQQYDEELQGATSTDAAEQSVVDPSTDASTDLPDDLPTDEEVAADAAADAEAADSEGDTDEPADPEVAETDEAAEPEADDADESDEPRPRRPATSRSTPTPRSTRWSSSVRRCAPRSATGSWCTPTPAWRTG